MGVEYDWDITDRPHTKLKLRIYQEYVNAWLKIFSRQDWCKEVYIIDCFAGRGTYDESGIKDSVPGSPLIAINSSIELFKDPKLKKDFKINCIFIEKDEELLNHLKKLIESKTLDITKIHCELILGDFNSEIDSVLKSIGNTPALFLIDPTGIRDVKKESLIKIVNKRGAKDIFLNYMQTGVERISGLLLKYLSEQIAIPEPHKKTIQHLYDYFPPGIEEQLGKDESEILRFFADEILKKNKSEKENERLEVIKFPMPYPQKSDILYYLLFASRKAVAVNIVRDIFSKHLLNKDDSGQMSLFPKKQLKDIHRGFDV